MDNITEDMVQRRLNKARLVKIDAEKDIEFFENLISLYKNLNKKRYLVIKTEETMSYSGDDSIYEFYIFKVNSLEELFEKIKNKNSKKDLSSFVFKYSEIGDEDEKTFTVIDGSFCGPDLFCRFSLRCRHHS